MGNMGMGFVGMLFPLLFAIVWIVVVVYGLVLATRFVTAVEKIARHMAARQ